MGCRTEKGESALVLFCGLWGYFNINLSRFQTCFSWSSSFFIFILFFFLAGYIRTLLVNRIYWLESAVFSFYVVEYNRLSWTDHTKM